MQDRRAPVRTERIGASTRWGKTVVAVAVVVLVAAIVKPWGSGSTGDAARANPTGVVPGNVAAPADSPEGAVTGVSARTTPRLAASFAPTVSPVSSAAGPARVECQNLDAWRILTLERNGTLQTRTLLPVAPVVATGPLDRVIVPVVFRAAALLAIGFCIPIARNPDVASTMASITIWHEAPDGLVSMLRDPTLVDPALAAVGEVYLAPPAPSGTTGWPAGLYTFEVPGGTPYAADEWFSLAFSPPVAVAGATQPPH